MEMQLILEAVGPFNNCYKVEHMESWENYGLKGHKVCLSWQAHLKAPLTGFATVKS